MKSIWMLLIVVLVIGCSSAGGYRIKGRVENLESGVAYLITSIYGVEDTIGQVEIEKGTFNFRGNCEEVTPVLLTLGENSIGSLPLFLENVDYDIVLYPLRMDRSIVNGGGEAQLIADRYRLCGDENLRAIDSIREEYMELTWGEDRFIELTEYVDSLQRDQELQKERYLKRYADSYLAMELLAINSPREKLSTLKEIYAEFSSKYQNSISGRRVASYIKELEGTEVGEFAPNFMIRDLEGRSFTLYEIESELKLIEFWASWCGPCRAMIPHLKKLYQRYHDQGLEILSVSMDVDESRWLEAVRNEEMPWLQGSDLQGNGKDAPLVKAYNIFGLPYSVLVDKENRILSERFSDLDELEELIDIYIKNKK